MLTDSMTSPILGGLMVFIEGSVCFIASWAGLACAVLPIDTDHKIIMLI